jgi:acyl transferase domain-containing protein
MVNQADDIGRKELLKSAYRKIEELRARLAASEQRLSEPVAIVGIGCRFPGKVTDLESFWQLLSNGQDGTSEIPLERWNIDDYYDADPEAPNKMYVRRGGFIDNIRGFDPVFFHVSPLEASSMDPQQRILLEVTWEALENAGQAPDQLAGSRTGVYIGMSSNDFAMMALRRMNEQAVQTHSATGISPSITAGHVSYFLGLRGPCMALDTACSSALTAIHLATQSLRRGETSMALAGSVNLILAPDGNVLTCKARMLAPDGKCKTFDASADGYSRSEGCAVLVLKLLSEAQANGDRILAVIHGSACNQDGRTNGITAPSGNAQREVIQAALAASGLSAHEVDYVETHGTGTSLGDPIEVQALAEVFAPNRPIDHKLVLGAVKTNIGHLEPTAGMAAISKVVLALQKQQIPANLHFNNPNPMIPWDSLPFTVPTSLTPWAARAGRRIAGVSAFGFSGTNVHMILGEAPAFTVSAVPSDRPCHLLAISAQSHKALTDLVARYVTFLTANPALRLADVCFTANTGRSHFAHRLSIIAATTDELKDALQSFRLNASGSESDKSRPVASQPPKVGLIISGQAPTDIHRSLYQISDVFRAAIDACDAASRQLFDISVTAALLSPQGSNHTVVSFAVSYATAMLWRDWGVTPVAVSGCGLGRHVADVYTGAITLLDGLRLAVDTPAVDSTTLNLSSFQREGIRVALTVGSVPTAAVSSLTLIASSNADWNGLLDAVGHAYEAGVPINWQKFEAPWRRQRVGLPTYPFQRQDCWPTAQATATATARESLREDLHPLLGKRLHAPQFRDDIVFEFLLDGRAADHGHVGNGNDGWANRIEATVGVARRLRH